MLVKSKEQRRVELITITSHSNKLNNKENHINNLFPIKSEGRPHQFSKKSYIFFSARVHPGELPGSHVLNGIFKFLLDKDNS